MSKIMRKKMSKNIRKLFFFDTSFFFSYKYLFRRNVTYTIKEDKKNHSGSNFFPNQNILANAVKKGGPPSFGRPVWRIKM